MNTTERIPLTDLRAVDISEPTSRTLLARQRLVFAAYAGVLGISAIAFAACGGAKGEEPTQTPESFRPTPAESPVNPTGTSPTASDTPTVKPPETGKGPEPTPTATATAKPTETATATVTATPPTLEVIPMDQIPEKLDSIVTSVNAQKEHFDPKITLESWQSRQENIRILVDRAKEALSKGDAEAARQSLLSLKTQVVNSGEVLKMKRVPDELKQAHDPKDKYIKQELVDERTIELYLLTIDILRSTDPAY